MRRAPHPLAATLSLAVFGAALVALSVLLAGEREARAQIFGPPMVIFGSVTDSAGPVAEDLPVLAFVGDTQCGEGYTEGVGEGDARVTVYFADVVSNEQLPGCGTSGAEVRIRIGDRDASQTGTWEAGFLQVDITFGDATPAAIPTFTPTPTYTPTPTNAGETTTPGAGEPTETATIAPGSPGAGSPVPTQPGSTFTPGTIPPGSPGAGSPAATLPGGVVPNTPGGTNGDGSGGGFPIWAAVILVVGGIALVGGGLGFAIARNRRETADPALDDDSGSGGLLS